MRKHPKVKHSPSIGITVSSKPVADVKPQIDIQLLADITAPELEVTRHLAVRPPAIGAPEVTGLLPVLGENNAIEQRRLARHGHQELQQVAANEIVRMVQQAPSLVNLLEEATTTPPANEEVARLEVSLLLSSACTVNRSQRNNIIKGNSLTNNGHQDKAHTGSQWEENVDLLNKTQANKSHLTKNPTQTKAIHNNHRMGNSSSRMDNNSLILSNIMLNSSPIPSSNRITNSPTTIKIKTHHSHPRTHRTTLKVAPRILPTD
ncbi:uncharacterized protein FIESC28_01942 [Fusarium coffeatum]|uniref:Uncharacterized protein n=1 Tax=Fusarium coffeatum TaxID=231269 RepID=A0A366S797_9HYPO|nr:uncharacterized protein FIESC28_01942 [Fusarium coffeatum]RBR25207.1 hypothetical protein FIESC28_01942 [Fusarium coffeatum]